MSRSALITITYSTGGGVATMTRTLAGFLEERGWRVRVAYYMPWSKAPELSVRFPGIGSDGPKWRKDQWDGGDLEAYQIGVRFPEFEWRRYRLNAGWKEAVEAHDIHLAVSGSLYPAKPIVASARPCLAWIATRYWPDKRDRLRSYPLPRRLFDLAVNTPVGIAWERYLARRVRLLALSSHTAQEFTDRVPGAEPTVMPMGVNTDLFGPEGTTGAFADDIFHFGFVGRLSDRRKNVELLVDVLLKLEEKGVPVQLHLVGGQLASKTLRRIEAAGLGDKVRIWGRIEHQDLPAFYRGLTVFVLPSYQEGLGIVGLEAMACGCPVVSTRCGGPEDYVKEGQNGYLVDFSADEMAQRVSRVLLDKDLRERMGKNALATVRERYSRERLRKRFFENLRATFGTKESVDA